ncbi:MAG: adenylate/guanylate cyclase domain-containing protein [Minwuia sp.]|nr:adenylate/guanylate cyclase domain-containing protein [Minwuia sp.]
MRLRIPRGRIGLRAGLTAGIGGLVLLAVTLVLVLGFGSARRNTQDLLLNNARVMLQLIENDIHADLRPVEAQVGFVGTFFEAERPEQPLDSKGPLAKLMTGALAATPATRGLSFVDLQAQLLDVQRQDGSGVIRRSDLLGSPGVTERIMAEKDRSPHWGEIIWDREDGTPLLTYRRSVKIDGESVGVLRARVPADRLARTVADAAAQVFGTAFVLHGQSRVLAHPAMFDGRITGTSNTDHLSATDFDDPILTALLAGRANLLDVQADDFESRIVRLPDDTTHVLLLTTMERYGQVAWTLVLAFPLQDVTDELMRLLRAALAGLGVLVVSLLIAFLAARRLALPLVRLSAFADRARKLDLDGLDPLPRSSFRELDNASASMNAMITGLRWFETYVPKRLVQNLMAQGGSAAAGSEERYVTVMFTDISGFTGRSEHWAATETADFLNAHFDLLATQIEATGGTIDKFIGDAVMAFWGAPEPQEDHAARAVLAARAIREAVAANNQGRADPVRVRIGLHTGPVIVGNIGAVGRMNYTIVGDTVNIANRLEAEAAMVRRGDSDTVILASSATVRAARATDDAALVGDIPLKGREEAVEAWLI